MNNEFRVLAAENAESAARNINLAQQLRAQQSEPAWYERAVDCEETAQFCTIAAMLLSTAAKGNFGGFAMPSCIAGNDDRICAYSVPDKVRIEFKTGVKTFRVWCLTHEEDICALTLDGECANWARYALERAYHAPLWLAVNGVLHMHENVGYRSFPAANIYDNGE